VTEVTNQAGGEGAWPEPHGIRRSRPIWRALVAPLEEEQDRWFLWVPVLFGLGIVL
jgi:hypothetical protein